METLKLKHFHRVFIIHIIFQVSFYAIVSYAEHLSIYFSIELPRKVEFSNETGTVVHCIADGTPKPDVQWTLADRSPLKDIPNLRTDYGNGTLYFTPFNAEDYREDVHATAYVCAASSYRGILVSNEVHVRAVVKQHYEVQVYDEFVIKGNTGVLKCYSPSFVEEYLNVVAWVIDGVTVISKHESVDRFLVTTHGDLYVSNVLSSDGTKKFQCKTINRLTSESKLSQVGRIMIIDTQSSMPPRVTHTKATVSVQQGDRVELICASQGLPIPSHRWFKVNDHEVTPMMTEGRVRQWKSLLLLTHAQISDSGIYKCVAINSVGEDNAETTLHVNAPITIQVTPKIQTVDVGKAAAMTCIANGYPPTTSFVWYKHGKPVVTNDRLSFTAGKILTIAGTQKEDQGIYQCFVRNDEISAYGVAELRLGRVLPSITEHFTQQAVLPGTNIALKCVASGNPTPTMRWSLDDMPTTATSSESYQATSGGDVISYLNITNVRMEDGGEYKCTADNGIGTATHAARMNVIGPPYVRQLKNVSVVAGQTVAVHCRVTGYPIHSITWKKGGLQLPLDPRQHIQKNGTLYIHSVDKSFDEGIYVCLAKNDRGDSASGQVVVHVTVPPQIAPFSFPPKLHVGTRARLQCVITEGDTPITFLWLKDGYPLTDDLELLVKQDDEFSSSLTFTTVNTRHNGNYQCVARNAAATANYSATLIVDVPPYWKTQPKDMSVSLSQSVVLTCTADGYPKPKLVWKKALKTSQDNFEELSYMSRKYEILENGSLLINAADEQDEGFYLCHATNGIGPGLNKVVQVIVEAAVHFDVKIQNVTSKKGDTVALMCVAKGDPPIKTIWNLNGLSIDANVDYRYVIKDHPGSNDITSVLEIYSVDVRDSGSYTCVAFNSFGKDEMVIHLNVRDIPDPPENVKITEHLSRYVRLTWMPPFDGGSPIDYYIIQYKNGSEDWTHDHRNVSVQHPETTAVIKNLRPGTAYSFRVIATNGVGTGKPSSGVGIRTTEEAPTGSPIAIEGHTEGSQSFKIKWKPPLKEDRNGEIVGYSVGYKIYQSEDDYTFKNIDVNASKYEATIIKGLSKYTQYSVIVKAFNRIGPGPPSKEIIVTTAEDVPSEPPSNIRCASLSSESMEVTWDPPSKNSQNGIIQNYNIRYRTVVRLKGNGGHLSGSYAELGKGKERVLPSTKLSTTIHNLQKYTNYSIQVTASTRIGEGTISEPIYCRTHEDVPGPPADIKAVTMSSNVILVAWKPPLLPNGQITTYNLYIRLADGNAETTASKHSLPPTNELQYEAKGLKEGGRYEFWVTASTRVGEGSSTRVVSQSAQIRAAAGIASFSSRVLTYWQQNVTLKCPIIGMPYPKRTWVLRNGNKSSERMVIREDGTLFVSRVQRQDQGNYSCSAKNTYGSDQITYELIVLAPPQAPSLTMTKVTTNSIEITIHQNADGGIPIKGYIVSYKEVDGKWKEDRLEATEEKITLRNLRCGTKYQIYVTAQNEVGIGEPSTTIMTSTRGTAPLRPRQEDIIQANVTSISLPLFRWPPNECPIHRYSLQYRRKMHTTWISVLDNVPPTQKVVVITHLEPRTSYEVLLTAYNDAGTTQTQYDVATLLYIKGSNGTLMIAPHPVAVTIPFYKDLSIIIPATSSTIATIAIMIGICICIHRQRRQGILEKSRHKDPQLGRALDAHQAYKFHIDQQLSGGVGGGGGGLGCGGGGIIGGGGPNNCYFHHHHQHHLQHRPIEVEKGKRSSDDCAHLNNDNENEEDEEEEEEEEEDDDDDGGDIIRPYATSRVLGSPRMAKALISPSRTSKRNEHALNVAMETRVDALPSTQGQQQQQQPSKVVSSQDEHLRQLALDLKKTLPKRQFQHYQHQHHHHHHLHQYNNEEDPDLLYHGPESETSDETDFEDSNFSISLDGKLHSGIDCHRDKYYPDIEETRTLYGGLIENHHPHHHHHHHDEDHERHQNNHHHQREICSNYPTTFVNCRPTSPLST